MHSQQHEIEDTVAAQPNWAPDRQMADAADVAEPLRVTPEEVALAAAALEEKRDADRSWQQKSLPIDEAILHLGLHASPQELAAEILTLRAERAAKAVRARSQLRVRRLIAIAGVLVLLGLITITGLTWASFSQSRRALHNDVHSLSVLPVQKLALVPDNVPVHIDSDTLSSLAKGEVTEEDVSVDTRSAPGDDAQSAGMFRNEWAIVKQGGVVKVCGWGTVEYALNITNNTTSALFSSRPGWLPANNLVPIEVPAYLLEGQPVTRFLPDGKQADTTADSALMVTGVQDKLTAVKDLVLKDVSGSDDNFLTYKQDVKGWSYADVRVDNDVVHITGNATSPRLKKLAGDVAANTLRRLHVPFSVSNELVIAQTDE